MAKCNTQANYMATTANNWQTPGASNPGRYNLIGSKQSDLMVPGIGVQERQSLTSHSRVDYLVDAGERKMIFRAGPIDMFKVNAHANCLVLLGDHDNVGEPLGVVDFLDELRC